MDVNVDSLTDFREISYECYHFKFNRNSCFWISYNQ